MSRYRDLSIDVKLPISPSWSLVERHHCKHCGSPARRHPQTFTIWGCLLCGFTTDRTSFHFNRDYPQERHCE